MQYVCTENAKFCRSRGMRQILFDDFETWPYDETSVSQILNAIELIFKKIDCFDAAYELFEYKRFISRAYRKFYGIE